MVSESSSLFDEIVLLALRGTTLNDSSIRSSLAFVVDSISGDNDDDAATWAEDDVFDCDGNAVISETGVGCVVAGSRNEGNGKQ